MPYCYKKHTYILGLVSLSILASSCTNVPEKKHEISYQSQIKKASSAPVKLENKDGFLITSLHFTSLQLKCPSQLYFIRTKNQLWLNQIN